jgi:formylglycine-generating enzyme required for sulfatase activity
MRIVLILLSLWAWNAVNAEMILLKPTAAAPDGRARVALVAGIAGYPELSSTNAFETLTHPLNDAQDIAAELQRYGFYIILLKDATQKEFESAVNCFASDCEDNWRIKDGSVALFYYSGHGLVVLDKGKKTNFVMPKRGFKDAADVKEYGFSTNWLLNKMKSAQIKLMFLDACRSEKSLLEKKGFSDEEAGFVKMDLDKFEEKGMSNQNVQGIIVGYASQEGKPAIGHKQQRNSFYTTGLLEMLRNNGHQTVDRLLKLTADRVFDLSMNKQMPWDDRRLIGDFCFGNCGGEKVFIPPQQPVKPEKVIQPEVKPVEIPVKTYILQVRADVSGAEIIVDNQILGKTPLDVELKEGSHEIIVRNNGRQDKQTIDMKANRDFNVEFGKAVSPVAATDKKTFTNSIGMEFVLIPAGSFQMGSNERDNEKPIHKVEIKQAFYLGKYEVTQKQWQAIMGNNPSYFKGENRPVEMVSWNDAQEFIKKLNEKEGTKKYRLPTEAEWEYAARAGSSSKWSFGDNENELENYAWYNKNSGYGTHEVGQKKPNGFGLFDMHGNVWEWTGNDYINNYNENSHLQQSSNNSTDKPLRGSSWVAINAGYSRSASRYGTSPRRGSGGSGFRVALLLPSPLD